jgi:hypothetical protein
MQPNKKRRTSDRFFEQRVHYTGLPASEDIIIIQKEKQEKPIFIEQDTEMQEGEDRALVHKLR